MTEESENRDEVAKEKDSDSHDGVDDTCADREKDKKAEPSAGKSQYEKDKEKNIAELQDILADLNAKYPMPELGEQVSKTQAAKKKQEKKNEKKEPVVRRESQRNKNKIRCVTPCDDQYPCLTVTFRPQRCHL